MCSRIPPSRALPNTQVLELTNQVATLETSISDAADARATLEHDLAQERSQVDALRTAREGLAQQLADACRDREALEGRLGEAEVQCEAMDDMYQQSQARGAELAERVEAWKAQCATEEVCVFVCLAVCCMGAWLCASGVVLDGLADHFTSAWLHTISCASGVAAPTQLTCECGLCPPIGTFSPDGRG